MSITHNQSLTADIIIEMINSILQVDSLPNLKKRGLGLGFFSQNKLYNNTYRSKPLGSLQKRNNLIPQEEDNLFANNEKHPKAKEYYKKLLKPTT